MTWILIPTRIFQLLFEVEGPYTRELILPVARMLEPLQASAFKHCRSDKQAALVKFLGMFHENDIRRNHVLMEQTQMPQSVH